MNVFELKNNIKKGSIENIYLFAGSEIGEKQEVLKILQHKIFGNDEPVIYTLYCDKEFDPANFHDIANSGLLFAEKKMIILKGIEQAGKKILNTLENYILPSAIDKNRYENELIAGLSGKSVKIKLLEKYYALKEDYYIADNIKSSDKKKIIEAFKAAGFNNINPDTYLVVMNEENDRISSQLTGLLTATQNITFWEMFENKKVDWVRSEVKKFNLFIEENAVNFLLDTIENNKQQLFNEITKIAVSFQEIQSGKNVIDRDFIEDYLYHSKEENAFTLFNAVMNKNLDKALDIVEKIFYTDEISLLGGIMWCQRRFIKVLDLTANQKLPVDEAFKQININGKKSRQEMNAGIKNYSFEHVSTMFYHLGELDYYLRILPQELKLIKWQEFIFLYFFGSKHKSFLQGPLQSLQY